MKKVLLIDADGMLGEELAEKLGKYEVASITILDIFNKEAVINKV